MQLTAENIYLCIAEAPMATKLCVGFGMAFILYYKLYVSQVPKLCCKAGKFKTFIENNLTILHKVYSPPPLFIGSIRQTILALFKGKITVQWDELEDIQMPDGGEAHLMWKHGEREKTDKPIIIFLPGLTGNHESNYIGHLSNQIKDMDTRVAVFTYRGMAGKELKTARTYCACESDDFSVIISHIQTRYKNAPIIATGVSLGAMILSHYLVKTGENSGITAAMIISVPWCPFEARKSLSSGLNRILFNKFLTKKLIIGFERNLHLFEDMIDVEKVKKSSTIHEFDEYFTSVVFGFESLDHYYSSARLVDKYHQIKTPLLALNAYDDMFSPGHSIPCDAISSNSDHIALVMTKYGGHVAFLDSWFGLGPSFMDRLFSQYVHAVFDNNNFPLNVQSDS